ncbi:MAG TPA: lamin tail domain-containing protein, partial [Blastocatellia bacterium]
MSRRNLTLLLCVSISLWFAFAPSSTKSNPEPLASITPQAATLIINEYLADPPPAPNGDANGDGVFNTTQDEFVELVNTGSVPLNISGFTISDALQVRYTIPSGKIIPSGEAAVIFGGGTPMGSFGNAGANLLVFAVGGAGLSLNNTGGDTITVKDSMGNIVDSLTYTSTEGNADQSITR